MSEAHLRPTAFLNVGLFAFGLIALFVFPPRDISFAVHSSDLSGFARTDIARSVQFENANVGISFDSSAEAGPESNDPQNLTTGPSFTVLDVNGDGLMDIIMTTRLRVLLYLNVDGHSFKDATRQYGLDDVAHAQAPGVIGFAPVLATDFDGDGKTDLVFGTFPQLRYYAGHGTNGRFTEVPNAFPRENLEVESLGAVDLDHDGQLEIVASVWKVIGRPRNYDTLRTKRDDESGGGAFLFRQKTPRHFDVDRESGFEGHGYAHSIGILDTNNDGWDDVFITNDYSSNRLYENVEVPDGKKRKLRDATSARLANAFAPDRAKRGPFASSMGLDIADWNDDGRSDIFLSNVYHPPLDSQSSTLWTNSDGTFTETFLDNPSIERCGFAWGTKFADFNNDGKLDLAVANGLEHSLGAKKQEADSLWYVRRTIAASPAFLGQPEFKTTEFQFSAFERDCLFIQHDGKFTDVAESSGIVEEESNRGIALIDFDNDGKMDFLVSGIFSPIHLRHNISTTAPSTGWIGFQLVSKTGNVIPTGAKVSLRLSNRQVRNVRLFPANGYRAQSDPRIHFGLGATRLTPDDSVEVVWPGGAREIFSNLKTNQYQNLHEGSGNHR